MSAYLEVVTPGPCTSIQDLGRFGFAHAGVPESGALDAIALRLANLLVGNEPGAGALEAMYVGPCLRVEAERVRIACVGVAGEAEIAEPGGDWRRAPFGQSFVATEGARVRCRSRGCATLYIAVEGGFDIAPALGSVATDVRSGLGGVEGRILKTGDRLPLTRGSVEARHERLLARPLEAPTRLRVLSGPQDDFFDADSLARFYAGSFVIGHGANRMGLRLEGPAIHPVRGFDITSDALAPGSIQIAGDGRPIVLLADRQTTGGYPKIATVISADVPALGRAAAGSRLSFTPVTFDEALAARRDMLAGVAALKSRIEIARGPAFSEAALREANLISGVTDGKNAS